MTKHDEHEWVLRIALRHYFLVSAEGEVFHHLGSRHRALLDDFDHEVAEVVIEVAFYGIYLGFILVGEALGELSVHQLWPVISLYDGSHHIGQAIEYAPW